MTKEKFTIFAMSLKGLRVIQAIINSFGAEVIDLVITAEDSHVLNDYSQNIRNLCQKNNIPVVSRKDKNHPINTEYVFAIGWKWMINTDAQLIVFHDSLLPKYRGFAPVTNALINGEDQIGVTAFFACDEVDAGDEITQEALSITYPILLVEVFELIAELYVTMIIEIIEKIQGDLEITTIPQNEEHISYSMWLDEEDYNIDWKQSNKDIRRFVDATGYPYLGAIANTKDMQYRVLEVEEVKDVVIENRIRHIGKVLRLENGCPVVVCGQGLLKITRMQNLYRTDILPFHNLKTRFK